MNKTDCRTIIKNYLALLECHNEQKHHINEYFQLKKIRTMSFPFFTGDYSFMILPNHILKNDQPIDFRDKFIIERKSGKLLVGGGFMELRNNIIGKHKEFKSEFQRMTLVDNVFLLIENAECLDDIYKVPNKYRITTHDYAKRFIAFINNRNFERSNDIKLVYTKIENSGETVLKLIFDYITNNL